MLSQSVTATTANNNYRIFIANRKQVECFAATQRVGVRQMIELEKNVHTHIHFLTFGAFQMADKRYLVFLFLVLLPPLCESRELYLSLSHPDVCDIFRSPFLHYTACTARFCFFPLYLSFSLSLLLFLLSSPFILDVKRDYRLMFIVDRWEWLVTIHIAHAKNTSGERTTANSLVYIGMIMVGQCARALNERWTQQELWTKWLLLWLRLGLRI